MFYEVLRLVILIAMAVLGFLIAVKPLRRALWTKLRAGLAYALLWLHSKQYEQNDAESAAKSEKDASGPGGSP